MSSNSMGPKGDGLEAARAAMQRDLVRANTAVGMILAVVLGLAIATVLAGLHAAREYVRAVNAETASSERLWNSYIAQSRAIRLISDAGRRENIFSVISNAAAIRRDAALRSEAIAGLALSDIEPLQPIRSLAQNFSQVEMDSALEHFAFGAASGKVIVGNVKDGTIWRTLQAPELGAGTRLPVRSVVFSPDGRKLAARFSGGTMVLWDLVSQEMLTSSGVDATNRSIAGMSFWPEEDKFSFADADADGQITVFDIAEKAKISTAIHVQTHPFRFRPGTSEVAIAIDNRVDLTRYPDETPLYSLELPTRIYALAWSPDGTDLAVSTEDGDICLWEVVHRTQRILRGHSEPCIRLIFSPDGKQLASGSRDGTTRLWDVALGQTLNVATEGIACAFSEDGDRIGYWKVAAGYGVWQLAQSRCYQRLICSKPGGALLSLDLSPSGRWCIATQTKGVRIWDLQNRPRMIYVPGKDLASARITSDERALYVCSRESLERWEFKTDESGVEIGAATRLPMLPAESGARAIAISLDCRWALIELTDLRLGVFSLESNAPPVFLESRSRQSSLRTAGSPTGAGRFAISPDGRWAVTGFGVGSGDHPKVWDARTGKLITTLPFGSAVVGFSPDGHRLGAAGTANFALWQVDGWKLLNRFDRDDQGVSQGSLAFMQNSDEIAVTRTRQLVQLRDGLGGAEYADLTAPQLQSVTSIRLALDGSVLVTASANDELQVWHLDTLRQKLAAWNLDWRVPQPNTPPRLMLRPKSDSPVQITLAASLAGFGLAAVFALASLRRHRQALAGYLAAETRAAQRNRELEVAKVELMHSQKMQALGTLAAGIAHDFNNLLSVIRMSNKLIGRETKGHPDIQENVADIEQAVIQGKSVVGSMLGYARAESHPMGPTDVCAVVEETVSLLSKEFLSGITLTLELDREAPKVGVVRGRLEQVLLNLVVNASEAMQGQGKMTLVLRRQAPAPDRRFALRPSEAEEYLELSLTDSGPGIAPEHLARIFDPFFTTKRSGAKAGTGLGLSLVYSIAQQDGLGLRVESAPDQGASFYLVIPILGEAPPVRQTHIPKVTNPT